MAEQLEFDNHFAMQDTFEVLLVARLVNKYLEFEWSRAFVCAFYSIPPEPWSFKSG